MATIESDIQSLKSLRELLKIVFGSLGSVSFVYRRFGEDRAVRLISNACQQYKELGELIARLEHVLPNSSVEIPVPGLDFQQYRNYAEAADGLLFMLDVSLSAGSDREWIGSCPDQAYQNAGVECCAELNAKILELQSSLTSARQVAKPTTAKRGRKANPNRHLQRLERYKQGLSSGEWGNIQECANKLGIDRTTLSKSIAAAETIEKQNEIA